MEFLEFYFYIYTATTEIYTLSLHDALPICPHPGGPARRSLLVADDRLFDEHRPRGYHPERPERLGAARSEEHTSELQSRQYLVCRLLLEKKKKRLGRNGGGGAWRRRGDRN